MTDHFYRHLSKSVKQAALLVILALITCSQLASAQEMQAAQEAQSVQEQTFPGLNEVIPQAASIASRVSDATALAQQATDLEDIYNKLAEKDDDLKKLEERYSPWEEINDWQFNRLLSARIDYNDLVEQQNIPLSIINTRLQTIEGLRDTWQEEETYWKEWQKSLRKTDVKLPSDAFVSTLNKINELLTQVTQTYSQLLKAQQKYSPAREVVTSRLQLINKTVEDKRLGSFHRDAYSPLEAGFYRQFSPNIFTSFVLGVPSYVHLPDDFFKRYIGVFTLQFITIVAILTLLVYRKRQSEELTREWTFLYRRPLSGAVFMTLVVTDFLGNPYSSAPLAWMLLIAIISIISGVRLLDGIYPQQQTRRVIRFIATLFIITEALRVFGLPTPLMQIYQILLCGTVTIACWRLISKQRKESEKLWSGIYPGGIVAVIGLTTAILGFVTLTTNLIVATLSSFIVIITLRMVLRLANGGIQAFMSAAWLKNRNFMQTLGVEEAIHKMQALVRIIVLINTGLYFLVMWHIFDDLPEAHETILSYQYSFGEFTFSVEMVLMVVVVLYLTTLISWVIQAFVESQIMTPRKMDLGVKESLKRLTHYGLITIGFLIAVSMAGLDLQKFTILAGALGVGIGFGMQNIVNNFVSGLILLFERPVKIGDTVTLGTDWGTITKIGLRSTVVETFDRSELIVPNADLISQKVTNWTYSSKIVRVNLPVGVAYGSPLEKVLEVLNNSAKEHSAVLTYPEVNTIFEGFGNSSIDFNLRFWIHTIDDRMKIRSEVAVIIDRKFREEGITIPFPQQDLHLRSIDSKLQGQFGAQTPESQPPTEETAE